MKALLRGTLARGGGDRVATNISGASQLLEASISWPCKTPLILFFGLGAIAIVIVLLFSLLTRAATAPKHLRMKSCETDHSKSKNPSLLCCFYICY